LLPLPLAAGLLAAAIPAQAAFHAGAAVVDVTPEKLPVLLNGGMLSRQSDKIKTRVNARAYALSDGRNQLAIVVVDSCMMSRPVLDEAKALAAKRTGIPADRILISATHSHTAPSSMGCLGTHEDPAYVPVLRARLVEAIVAAQANLEPARVGFAKANAAFVTHYRGMTVERLYELRKKVRAGQGEVCVIKNRLARIAAKGTFLEGIADDFKGPVALILSYKDPVGVAKAIVESLTDDSPLAVKTASLEGKKINSAEITALSKLPDKQTLLAMLFPIRTKK
jgi:ribosomal protein L10